MGWLCFYLTYVLLIGTLKMAPFSVIRWWRPILFAKGFLCQVPFLMAFGTDVRLVHEIRHSRTILVLLAVVNFDWLSSFGLVKLSSGDHRFKILIILGYLGRQSWVISNWERIRNVGQGRGREGTYVALHITLELEREVVLVVQVGKLTGSFVHDNTR